MVTRSVNVLVNTVGEIQYTEFNIRYDSVNNLSRGDKFSFDALPRDLSIEEYSDTKREQYLQTGTIAPEFILKDMNGNKISLSDYHGKLILADFWFLNCGYCIQSMPEIEAISTHYQNLGLVVLGINAYDTDKQRLGKFFQVNKIDFPQLIDGLEVSGFYRVFSYPADYLIDPQGKII